MELQDLLDEAFDDLKSGAISRDDYLVMMDSLSLVLNKEVEKEFGFRKDVRTLKEFAAHMLDQMEIENAVIEHWIDTLAYDTFPTLQAVTYSGIREDARLLCESSATKDEIRRPDVKLTFNDGSVAYLEIKQCPVLYKATYKTSDLKHYHSLEEDVYMLTAHTKGKFSPDKVKFYTLLAPVKLSKLLDDGRQGILKSEKRREMGYKKAVQFTKKGLEDYFLIQEC